MVLTLDEQSLMFCRRKPRSLLAFPTVIAYVLTTLDCQWLRCQGIYLCWMFLAFCYGWHTMFHDPVFFWHYSDGPGCDCCALSCIKFHLPVFLPLFQWWQIWLESLLVSVSSDALKEEAVICEQLGMRGADDIWKIIKIWKKKKRF